MLSSVSKEVSDMLAFSLPEDLDTRLEDLARSTGKTKAALVEEAIAAISKTWNMLRRKRHRSKPGCGRMVWLPTTGCRMIQAEP